LIRTAPEQQAAVASLLEDRLGDEGFDARETRGVLHDLLAVQNTYLSTFQSLGALGLLLGTLGLATVQLRSVMERRGELALMRAAGFRRRRLALLVILEHAVLLVGGLTAGVLAAALAVWPQYLGGGARVPGWALAGMLAAVLAAGLAAGLGAVRAALSAPLLTTLREE
jgi:ABC-type antimicrobial peptide transport system permease subunit